MPIFEYACKDCDHKFEKLVLSSDDHTFCDNCNSEKLEKLFSTFGVKSDDSTLSSSENAESGCMCTPSSCGCSVN